MAMVPGKALKAAMQIFELAGVIADGPEGVGDAQAPIRSAGFWHI
ncbi:hypothetical protein [Nonomuraea rubra]